MLEEPEFQTRTQYSSCRIRESTRNQRSYTSPVVAFFDNHVLTFLPVLFSIFSNLLLGQFSVVNQLLLLVSSWSSTNNYFVARVCIFFLNILTYFLCCIYSSFVVLFFFFFVIRMKVVRQREGNDSPVPCNLE